jgi:hypothetical protein
VCCVLSVGDEMFICGQGTGIYAATRDDTIWGYLVVRYCMAGSFMSVCSAVDVCVCVREGCARHSYYVPTHVKHYTY